MAEKEFKFIDLCAGVGAGHYAFKLLGGECIGFSEIDPSAERTYRYLHGDYQNYGDLMEIEASRLPAFDGLLAGFPCQSFSVVGKRKGLIDPRGKVIYGITNILKQAKPKFFLLENVKGLLSIDSGRTFNFIIELLSSAGYKTFSEVLNSMYYDVPHSRERIYIVGFRNDLNVQEFDFPKPSPIKDLREYLIDRDPQHILSGPPLDTFKNNYLHNKYNQGAVSYEKILKTDYLVIDTRQSDLRIYENFVPTIRTGRQGILYVRDGILRKLSGYEAFLLQGFGNLSSKTTSASIPNSKLLAQAGNAMTVNVMSRIGKIMLELLNAKSERLSGTGI